MKRRTLMVIAVLAAAGLVAFVAYVQGAGPFARPCSKTAAVEVQAVHMTNGAASEVGCCATAASAAGVHAGCTGDKDGKCAGDCTACPAMKEGNCPGAASGCQAMSASGCAGHAAGQTTAACEGAKSGKCAGVASTAKTTGGCPGAQASSAKQTQCGGCPFSTK